MPDPQQMTLPLSDDLPERFKRVYYHLYSNSESSRAERLFSQVSLVLLAKYMCDKSLPGNGADTFLSGSAGANQTLLPAILAACPTLQDEEELRFTIGDDAIREILLELSGVRLDEAPSHVLGEAFQALIGPRIRGDKGQFFTPRSVVSAIVRILAPKPGEKVIDPACGTGGFLSESYFYMSESEGGELGKGDLVGIEKDRDLFLLGSAMMHVATKGVCQVLHQNSLGLVASGAGSLIGGFDVVMTNPPFGAKIGIREPRTLSLYELGHNWALERGSGRWIKSRTLRKAQDPQLLFLELCIRLLRPGGRLGIVLPEGVFGNKGMGYVWDWLRAMGTVEALIDCPRTTFQPGTDTKTNILFFRKGREGTERSRQKAMVAVGIHCGHDRRGRNVRSDGTPYPDDYPEIARAYSDPAAKVWHEVHLSNPYYLVPRYYVRDVALTEEESRLLEGARYATMGELIQDGTLTIRKGHEPGSEAYGTGSIPFVRTSDISNLEIRSDPTKSVSEEVFRKYSKKQKLRPGDVLMVVDGRYRIGTPAILDEFNYRCVVQSHLRVLTVKSDSVLKPYSLLYALTLPSVYQLVRNLVFIQSTLGTLGKRILELRIPILHGDGPWAENVVQFEQVLRQRAALLNELQQLIAEPPSL